MDERARQFGTPQAQAIREILRMVRAVVRDGEVSELEAELLRFWLDENRELLASPPLDRVRPVLDRLLSGDGPSDPGPDERDRALRVLRQSVEWLDGGSSSPDRP